MVSRCLSSSAPRLPSVSPRSVSLLGLCRLRGHFGPLWRTEPVSHRLWRGELYGRRRLSGLGLDLSEPLVCPQGAALQRAERLRGQLWWKGLRWGRGAGGTHEADSVWMHQTSEWSLIYFEGSLVESTVAMQILTISSFSGYWDT